MSPKHAKMALQGGDNIMRTPLKHYKGRKTCTQRQKSIATTVSFDTVVCQTEQHQTCRFLGQWPDRGPLPFNNFRRS